MCIRSFPFSFPSLHWSGQAVTMPMQHCADDKRRARRRYVRDKAGEFASSASDYAKQAGDAIKNGVGQVRDRVSNATNRSTESSTPACPTNM